MRQSVAHPGGRERSLKFAFFKDGPPLFFVEDAEHLRRYDRQRTIGGRYQPTLELDMEEGAEQQGCQRKERCVPQGEAQAQRALRPTQAS